MSASVRWVIEGTRGYISEVWSDGSYHSIKPLTLKRYRKCHSCRNYIDRISQVEI